MTSLPTDGDVGATVRFMNNDPINAKPVTLIVALYDVATQTLEKLNIKEINVPASGVENISAGINSTIYVGKKVVAFLWDGLNRLTPYEHPISLQ